MSAAGWWLAWFPQATGADMVIPLGGGLMRAIRHRRPGSARREWTYSLDQKPAYDRRMGWEYGDAE